MKKLILILMFSSLFTQSKVSSSLDVLILKTSKSYTGEYQSMDENYIYFIPKGNIAEQRIEKRIIEKVILSDGTVIFDFVKSVDTYVPPKSDSSNLTPQYKTMNVAKQKDKIVEQIINYKNKISGGLIAFGSGLLIINTNRECKDCSFEDIEEYTDSIKLTQTLGFFFIAVGGIIMTL